MSEPSDNRTATARRRVLITGATGGIGRKLCRHLEAQGRYELLRLCLNPDNDPGVTRADLATADPAWTGLLSGVDTIVHLAGNPRNQAGWDTLIAPNIDALLNVYIAAARHGVRRVVFASSVWSLYGYRFTDDPLVPSITPAPTNPYGATKLFGEQVGKCFFDQHAIETIAFRIGACRRVDNQASSRMTRGDWEQACWLSDRDMCQAMEKAIETPTVGFAILNLTSDIEGSRWSLAETRRVIGYAPQDRYRVEMLPRRRAQAAAARLAFQTLPAGLRRLVPASW